jgi:hypothetical protein
LVSRCGVFCDYNALQSQRIKNLQAALRWKILQIEPGLLSVLCQSRKFKKFYSAHRNKSMSSFSQRTTGIPTAISGVVAEISFPLFLVGHMTSRNGQLFIRVFALRFCEKMFALESYPSGVEELVGVPQTANDPFRLLLLSLGLAKACLISRGCDVIVTEL